MTKKRKTTSFVKWLFAQACRDRAGERQEGTP